MQTQIYTQLTKSHITAKNNREETDTGTLRIIQSKQHQQPSSDFIIQTASMLQKEKQSNLNNYKSKGWDLTLSLMFEAWNVMILSKQLPRFTQCVVFGFWVGERSFRANVEILEMRKFSDFELYIYKVFGFGFHNPK
jgi:hypothetical protein